MTSTIRARRIPSGGRGKREARLTTSQRVALLTAVAVGVVLRIDATVGSPAAGDATSYTELAARFSWLDPWHSSFREPLWIAVVKVTTGLFGYSLGAMQVLDCAMGVAGLLVAVWALRQVCSGWVLVAGVAALAVATWLVDIGSGTREGVGVLIAAAVVGVAARAPGWLPVLAAVALGVRWEMGVPLMAVSVALALGRVVEWRQLVAGGALAVALVGPFLVNNARDLDDPMFHSDNHATFYANIERMRGITPAGVLPADQRIHPMLGSLLYREPLVTWGEYITDTIGVDEALRRERRAAIELPVDTMRLGRLPEWVGVLLAAVTLAGAVHRRDRVSVVVGAMIAAGVAGYGLTLPWFDRRLMAPLTVLLVGMFCAGVSSAVTSPRGACSTQPSPDPRTESRRAPAPR